MKILHTCDLHIREKEIEEIDRVLQFIVATAQREKPDLCVIAGDIFDSRDVRVDSRSAIMAIGFVSALMDVCPVAIVIGTPSHDGSAPKIMRYVRGKFDCVVADHPEQIYLYQGALYRTKMIGDLKPEAIITLIPQPTKQYWQSAGGVSQTDQEIGAAMGGVFAGFGVQAANYPGVPHIGVYHGEVSGSVWSNGQQRTGVDIAVSTDQLALLNAGLLCLGHIHRPQRIGENGFYAGDIYMKDIGEDHKHGFYVHVLATGYSLDREGKHTEIAASQFIETPCRKVVRVVRDYTKDDADPIIGDGMEGAYVRVDLTVWQDEAEKIDREEIRRNLTGDFGAVEVDLRITRVPRETVRAESVLKAETLGAKIEERARITGEDVPAGVLDLADLLEGSKAEELLARVMSQ